MKNISREEKIKELMKSGIYKVEELSLLQDAILDDLYLKHMITSGKISKNDCKKPWVTYYKDRPHKFIDTNKSLYQNYVSANEDNMSGVAVYDSNNDRVIKHDELKQLIDAFSRGLLEYGIDNNTRVGVLILGSYEEPICLLSPNKNGALIKYLDFLKGPGSIKEDIEKSKLNILFMDELLLPLEPIVNEKKIPVVVLNASKDYSNTQYLSFDRVLKEGASKPLNESYNTLSNEPSLIINSSGTTGIPKPIVHSNKTVNSSAQKKLFIDFPMNRENFVFKSIPSHIGFGLINTMYSSLVSGTGIILNHSDTPDQAFAYTIDLLKNYNSFLKNHNFNENAKLLLYTSPMFYRVIFDKIKLFDDLSFMGGLLGAGSKMSKEELNEMKKMLLEKNCNLNICNGYGQNELAGPVTCNDNSYNINGSAGYPVIGTDIKIVNIDSLEEMSPFKEGRILEKSDSEFLYYEGMEDETHRVKITMPDGSEWFDSKDLGYFDENGFVFVTGRSSRVLIRSDFKLSMDMIENKIKSNPAVKECAIITQNTNGVDEDPIAYVILNDEYKNIGIEKLIDEIQNSNAKLSDVEMPIAFNIVEELPYLSSGKIDYQKVLKLHK